eukprot:04995.XXX_108618_108815_1 [CDS] Oithona nana genome sequencing.
MSTTLAKSSGTSVILLSIKSLMCSSIVTKSMTSPSPKEGIGKELENPSKSPQKNKVFIFTHSVIN